MGFEVTTAGVLRVYLRVHQGVSAGQKFSVLEYPATIGRGTGCQVQLDDRSDVPTLSRQHARLHLEGGRITIEDLSRNGTWVDNRQLERGDMVVLRGGEPIWLGTETLITVDFSANTKLVAQEHPSRRRAEAPLPEPVDMGTMVRPTQAATQRQIIPRTHKADSFVSPAPSPVGQHRLVLRTLGRVSVEVDETVLPDHLWSSRKALVLLVYLAENDPDSAASERLVDVLWSDGRGGRSALQTAVYRVRQALLGHDKTLPDPLRCDRHRYSLASAYQITADSRVFEAGCRTARHLFTEGQHGEAQARLEAALPLYQGAFMEDASEDWVVQRRIRLADLYVDASMALALLLERQAEWRRAQDIYGRILEYSPAREPAQCGLLRCLAQAGHRDEALRLYEHSVRQLKKSLDMGPGADLLALREALSRDLPLPPAPLPFT